MDILEARTAAEALRETRAALEFALDSAQIGDWDLDLIHDTSRRSLRHDQCFGYRLPIPEDDWGIEVFIQHVYPEDRAFVESSLRNAVNQLLGWSAEFRVVWPDGTTHWLAARGSIYRTEEGKATRMLGIVMDITNRKQVQEALSASEQLARGQVAALTRTVDALAMESSPDALAEHVLRTIIEQLGAHSLSAWRRHGTNGQIEFDFAFEDNRIVTRLDSRFAGLSPWLPSAGLEPWLQVFRTGTPDLIEDIRIVPSFPLKDRLLGLGIITVLMLPMSIAGRLEGAIGIRFNRRREFREEEMVMAQAMANQVMIALQLMRLSAQSRNAAVLAERNRMARDIHDTLAQGFTGIIVQLQASSDARSRGLTTAADEHVERACDLARDSLHEARRSVLALRPQALQNTDLAAALGALLKKMTAGTALQSAFEVAGVPTLLPQEWDANLLHISREVLTNALRHAQASNFKALLEYSAMHVRLELRDTGRGFDSANKHEGFGLLGILERTELMNGKLTVESTINVGTTILITLPLLR